MNATYRVEYTADNDEYSVHINEHEIVVAHSLTMQGAIDCLKNELNEFGFWLIELDVSVANALNHLRLETFVRNANDGMA